MQAVVPREGRAWFDPHRVTVAGEVERTRDLSLDFSRYVAERRPVVFAGALRGTFCDWDFDYLSRRAGHVACRVLLSRDGQFPGGHWRGADRDRLCVASIRLSECLARMANPDRFDPIVWEGERQYLYQIPLSDLGMLGDVELPERLRPRPRGLGRYLWISQPGNITPPHADFAENLLGQIHGTKEVLLWDAKQYRSLYLHPLGEPHEVHSRLDITEPDLERFPDFSRARALSARLEPGDVLYIPFDAVHCVHSATASISLNHWWGKSVGYRAWRLLTSPLGRFCLATPAPMLQATLRQEELSWVRRVVPGLSRLLHPGGEMPEVTVPEYALGNVARSGSRKGRRLSAASRS